MTNAEKFSTIRFEENGGIARIILDRPRVLNAIDPEMVLELNTAMDRVAKDDAIKVVVVSGEGRAFSAGFDLKASAARGPLTIAQWRQVLEDDLDLVLRFWDCPKPTIAAIHGYCIGGAFEVALACDISIAAESSLLGEPEVRFGSGIMAMLLPWITGPKQAKEILLTGEDRLTAGRALQLGIVNRVVPDAELLQNAQTMASRIIAAAPSAVQFTKKAINRTYEIMGLRQALLQALEIDIFIESSGGPERETFNRIRRDEGLQAALAWRDARSVNGGAKPGRWAAQK
ncbi:MAG: enoyl-CoA hydratase/isomerase family protein [Rhizobiaceae bacterium]